MNVCVRGDLAGGAIQASAATTIGGIAVALRGDAVTSHAPCPVVPVHCSATMTASPVTNINGVPVVVQGDPATCAHPAISSTGVTITPTPVDPDRRPGAPGAPTVAVAGRSLDVSWEPVALADGYKVQWRSGDDPFDASRQAVVMGTSYRIPDLVADIEYSVRLIATRASSGDGPPSAVVTATPVGFERVALSAPGSSFVAVPGFLAIWSGDFGALPGHWFADGADTVLERVRINSASNAGTVVIDIGSGRNDILADVRGDLELQIGAAGATLTLAGIGGADTTEPYTWVPDNADEVEAFFQAIAGSRNLPATFTFSLTL